MKRFLLITTILFCYILTNAQNPFEAYGYTPKIATLSNGKYNEFHDLDTIVQIGTVLFNTQTKQIVAFLQVDTLYSEATLQPDIVSMWMSPDPLSDERPSLSPYNYCQNNPIVLVDPDGRLDDYYLNLKSGQVEYHAGSENRFDQGLVNIAGDNATVGDIQDALTQRNYNYQKDASVPGGFRVDTEKQYKGWAMMQYYDPEIVGTILFMSLGTGGNNSKNITKTSSRVITNNVSKTVTAPKGWITEASKKGGGKVFRDPKNPHNIIRQMPGNSTSPNPAQQNPYVKFMKEGKFYNVNGKPLNNGNLPDAHIPLDKFDITKMPKFN